MAQQSQTVDRTESTDLEAQRIDEAAGIVYGVKTLGRVSKNGGRYSDQAIRDHCALFEGNKVNIDHPPRTNVNMERSLFGKIGVVKNLRPRLEGNDKTDGAYGDLHYFTKHKMAPVLVEDVKRHLGVMGFSHVAKCKERYESDGSLVIEGLVKGISLDLVGDAATVTSLMESVNLEQEDKTMAEEAVPVAAAPMAPSLQEAFMVLQNAIMASPDHDDTERLAIMKDMFKFKAKVMGDPEGEEAPGEMGGEGGEAPPVGESTGFKRSPSNKDKVRRLEIKDMCRDHGLAPDNILVESLLKLDDEQVEAQLQYLAKKFRKPYQSGPTSRSPQRGTLAGGTLATVMESEVKEAMVPLDDPDKLAQYLNGM